MNPDACGSGDGSIMARASDSEVYRIRNDWPDTFEDLMYLEAKYQLQGRGRDRATYLTDFRRYPMVALLEELSS